MVDINNCFKYAILLPIIVTLLVSILIIPILSFGNYEISINSTNYNLKSFFIWPTPGFSVISSPFGKRVSPTKGASTYHNGIDIPAYQGSNVLSVEDGIVLFAGWDKSGGYMVKIKHNNNLQSAYCHLSEVLYVSEGDKVYKGETIGTVGPKYLSNGQLNGATTGVHLHFAIYMNGKAIDPMRLFE